MENFFASKFSAFQGIFTDILSLLLRLIDSMLNLPRISFSMVGDAAVFCGAASVAAAGAGSEKIN